MGEEEKKVIGAEVDFEALNSIIKNLEKNLSSLKDIGDSLKLDESRLNKISSEVESVTNKFDSVVDAIENIKSNFNNFRHSLDGIENMESNLYNFQHYLEKIERDFESLNDKPVAGTLTTSNSIELIKKIFSLMSENETESLVFGRVYLPEIFNKDFLILKDSFDGLPKFIQEIHQLLEELSIFIEYNYQEVKIIFKK